VHGDRGMVVQLLLMQQMAGSEEGFGGWEG